MPKLSVDQFSQRCRVRFVAGMPGLQPSELRVGRAGAGLGHLGQAQVDRVGQDRGQQQVLVLGQIARFQVREVPGEARPLIDFEQQFGDLDVRQDHGCLVYQRLRGVGHRRIQRRDLQARLGDDGIRQGTVAKLAMRQPFVLFKGLTFQKLCLPGAFRPGDHHNKMLRPGLCVVHASPQYL